MRLGLMNNPQRTVLKEMERIAGLGLEFIDLTLEPPNALPQQLDTDAIRAKLAQLGLGVVGHTAYYLPFASPFDKVQQGAVAEAIDCLEAFARVGASVMNLHLDRRAPNHSPDWVIQRNIAAISALVPDAERLGIRLMVENVEGDTPDTLSPVLAALPTVGFHLDIGHANIGTRKSHTAALLTAFGDRLAHVHLSDNKGKSDDHLAIGAGTIEWRKELKALKASGYDGTVTLETFYGDSTLIDYSMNRVRTLWETL